MLEAVDNGASTGESRAAVRLGSGRRVSSSSGEPSHWERYCVTREAPSKDPEQADRVLDPVQDPETAVQPDDLPQPPPTPADSGPQVKPRPDVRWLVEKVRRQYARRSTL